MFPKCSHRNGDGGQSMDILGKPQRRAFSVWLRTGRRPRPGDDRKLELKFNPWHDPDDGRFTFRGAGRYYGAGGASRADGRGQRTPKVSYIADPRLPPISTREQVEAWRTEELARNGHRPGFREAIEDQHRRYLKELNLQARARAGGLGIPDRSDGPADAVARRSTSPSDQNGFGGGGSFGGGGASGSWEAPKQQTGTRGGFSGGGDRSGGGGANGSWGGPARAPDGRVASDASEPRHIIVRNGYTYEIDARGRTRRVSGVLSDTDTPVRSATTQAKAGNEDRRTSDDGGHYIAARFEGPTDAFNHFAQNANFNRGRYRVLEDEWAKAKQAGKEVTVTIVPHYREGALRPFEIDVSFTANGQKRSIKMPNERTEKRRGKR